MGKPDAVAVQDAAPLPHNCLMPERQEPPRPANAQPHGHPCGFFFARI